MCFLFIASMYWAGEYRREAFVLMLFPTADFFSDLGYLLIIDFYDIFLFWAATASFVVPNALFGWELIKRGATPCFWIPYPLKVLPSDIDTLFWLARGSDGRCQI